MQIKLNKAKKMEIICGGMSVNLNYHLKWGCDLMLKVKSYEKKERM